MQKEAFAARLRALVPRTSGAALQHFISYAGELGRDGAELSGDFYDAFYVELSLVKRDHGEQIAETLVNYGEQFTMNPFELRGAARLAAQGWPLEKIEAYIVENGCAPTQEEAAESRAVLSAFRSGHMDAVPMPREGFRQEMG